MMGRNTGESQSQRGAIWPATRSAIVKLALLLAIGRYLREPFLARTTPNLLGIFPGLLLPHVEPRVAALTSNFL